MTDAFNFPGNYRIEVSGWGLDGSFFVEKTDLLWSQNGDKQVQLHRALGEGAIIFVRLLTSVSVDGSSPVAYQAEDIHTMDCNGRCEMRLLQLYPRSKAPRDGAAASYIAGESSRIREPRESSMLPEPEEILQ